MASIQDWTPRQILLRAFRDPVNRTKNSWLARWIQSRQDPSELMEFIELGHELFPKATSTNWRNQCRVRVARNSQAWSLELFKEVVQARPVSPEGHLLDNSALWESCGLEVVKYAISRLEKGEYHVGGSSTFKLLNGLLERGFEFPLSVRLRLVELTHQPPDPESWLSPSEIEHLRSDPELPSQVRKRLDGAPREASLSPSQERIARSARGCLFKEPDLPCQLLRHYLEQLKSIEELANHPRYWVDAALHPQASPALITDCFRELFDDAAPQQDERLWARGAVLRGLGEDLPDPARQFLYEQSPPGYLYQMMQADSREHLRETLLVVIDRFPERTITWFQGEYGGSLSPQDIPWEDELTPHDLRPLLEVEDSSLRSKAMRIIGQLEDRDSPSRQTDAPSSSPTR